MYPIRYEGAIYLALFYFTYKGRTKLALTNAARNLFQSLKGMAHHKTNYICMYPKTEVGDMHTMNHREIADAVGLSARYTKGLLWQLMDAGFLAKASVGYEEKYIINCYVYYNGKTAPDSFLLAVFNPEVSE